jgi:predicted ATPase
VTILGDAGVGKTRLVRELWQRLPEQTPEPLRRTGRCLSYGTGTAYWALGEVLKEHLGLLESDQPEVALERLGTQEILGLTLGLDVARDLHPLATRDRFQDAWAEFLTNVVAEQPAALLIEDVHWAEGQLLDLLEYVLGTADGPLLVIVTARPEFLERRPGWGARSGGELLELEPLSARDCVRMLDELLAGGLPAELSEMVVERAEGNPFFVEELLGVLLDRGLLVRQNGGWVLHELPREFAVPDSVQAVLAARIDLLGSAEKSALQAAAVIGRVFWTGPVYELLDAKPDLQVLEDRDFVRRRAGSSIAGEREYVIKHALTREVAYESLPRARRHGCTQRSRHGSSSELRAAMSLRLCLRTTTRRRCGVRTRTSRGRERRKKSNKCAGRRFCGSRQPLSSRCGATRSRTHSSSCVGRFP